MYKIVFLYYDGYDKTETYGGGSYYFQGEKYAVLNNAKPKLYKSKSIAERSAQQLTKSCVNVVGYEIVEVDASFSEEHKSELREKLTNDNHTTDSDIEDFCDEHDLPRKNVFHYIATQLAPDVCKGCKYVDQYNSLYPCKMCSRAHHEDFYEKEDK